MIEYIVTGYQHSGGGRIGICLNETISLWLYEGEARQLSIQEGTALTEEQYAYILHDIIGKRAMKRAMHLLERQERTECQLREKLVQGGYPQAAIEDAIAYVKGYHYIDDERYARNYIHFHQEGRSRLRLRSDLMRRGISRDLADLCIEEEFCSDEREQIRSLLEKKHFSPDTSDRKEFRKIYQFLMRRGFRSSDILAVMQYSL